MMAVQAMGEDSQDGGVEREGRQEAGEPRAEPG
jgi:hypothetical protein